MAVVYAPSLFTPFDKYSHKRYDKLILTPVVLV